MAFKIRRGTDAQRTNITPQEGELIYTTDTKKLFIGDGTTLGGNAVNKVLPIEFENNILTFNPTNKVEIQQLNSGKPNGKLTINQTQFDNSATNGAITLNQIHNTAGSNNIIFYRARGTPEAKLALQEGDAIIDILFQGHALQGENFASGPSAGITVRVAGNPINNGATSIVPGDIVFYTASRQGLINYATVIDSEGVLRSNKISALSPNSNLEISNRNGTGSLQLNGMKWPNTDGSNGNVLTTNGAGELSWTTVAGGGSGTVTSVSGTGTVNGLTLTGTVTTSGNLTLGGTLTGDFGTGAITTTAQKNRIRFHWDTLATLQSEVSAVTYHGMIAHVHSEGRIYFAHNGNWVPVANQSELGGGGSGTVTSVSGTGTVNGLTLTGTVTTSGNLTLGGTLTGDFGTEAITTSAEKNKIRFYWQNLDLLNSEAPAGDYHGMIAHVHNQGRLYFAHGGDWVPVANYSELGGGSSFSRTTVYGNSPMLDPGQYADVNIINESKGYLLYKIIVNQPAWVRIYVSSTARTADSTREEGVDPAPDSGVIAEVITSASNQAVLISPGTIGFNDEPTPNSTIFLKVTNKSASTTEIITGLTIVNLEI
jgi:hypothetical protein